MCYLMKHLPWSDRHEMLNPAIGILGFSNYLCALFQMLYGLLEISDAAINLAFDRAGHTRFRHPFQPRDLVLDKFSQRVSVAVAPHGFTPNVQHALEDADIACGGE